MTIMGTIKCDRCDHREDAPADGGYPPNWGALTFKASQHPTSRSLDSFRDKRRWFHVCTTCVPELQKFLLQGNVAPPSPIRAAS